MSLVHYSPLAIDLEDVDRLVGVGRCDPAQEIVERHEAISINGAVCVTITLKLAAQALEMEMRLESSIAHGGGVRIVRGTESDRGVEGVDNAASVGKSVLE